MEPLRSGKASELLCVGAAPQKGDFNVWYDVCLCTRCERRSKCKCIAISHIVLCNGYIIRCKGERERSWIASTPAPNTMPSYERIVQVTTTIGSAYNIAIIHIWKSLSVFFFFWLLMCIEWEATVEYDDDGGNVRNGEDGFYMNGVRFALFSDSNFWHTWRSLMHSP